MATKSMVPAGSKFPVLFDDFFKPWNEWFETGTPTRARQLTIPAVNVESKDNGYILSFAAPGKKKEDFDIQMDGNMLTVSSEEEESREEKQDNFTRREYNFASFSRSFTIPDDVNLEKIEATYENGVLKISLPRRMESPKANSKNISVK